MSAYYVEVTHLEKFCTQALAHYGVRAEVARDVVAGLVQTSVRGIDSHGVRLLPHYLRGVRAGRLNPNPNFKFKNTLPAVGRLDGDHTFGHAAGAQGMRHAIELARNVGMGAVAVYNSSHFGAAAYYALLAAQQGLIGISFTHADALTRSHNGTRAYFGTNPICLAAPCDGEEPFCFDMAPTQITWNRVMQHREQNKDLPLGLVADAQGVPTTDPHLATSLLPIGLYKGYGLAMMVEILCSLLTGMPFGRHISKMFADPISQKRYLGQFFIAMQIDAFVDAAEFKQRLAEMMAEVRAEPVADPAQTVLVPGDPEKQKARERLQTGVPLTVTQWREFQTLANEIGMALEARHG